VIEVTGLTKRYGRATVLYDVSLSIGRGERVAFVGPNGSGKTTLLRCLLGLVRGEGSVRVVGHDPVDAHAEAQAHVAYVPQRAPAMPATVRELVRAWAGLRGADVGHLGQTARVLGLDLDAATDKEFTALSGGMQQKLLAALALATDCPILLLDEPTANLDPAARAAFFDLLGRRAPAPTIVLSSHRLDEIRHLVDRVVVLADGRVAFDDAVERFLRDPRLAAAAGLTLAHA
jgi:ABC-2 type transport system ATP-binding protein